MPLEKHDLADEFPEHRERIHALKPGNSRFAHLFADHHDADKTIRRIETGAEMATDDRLEGLKRRWLGLKDELYGMIRATGA